VIHTYVCWWSSEYIIHSWTFQLGLYCVYALFTDFVFRGHFLWCERNAQKRSLSRLIQLFKIQHGGKSSDKGSCLILAGLYLNQMLKIVRKSVQGQPRSFAAFFWAQRRSIHNTLPLGSVNHLVTFDTCDLTSGTYVWHAYISVCECQIFNHKHNTALPDKTF